MTQEQKSERLHMRVTPSFLQAIDEWRQKQSDVPDRMEAIRRLVQIGLSHMPTHRRLSPKARAHASAIAADVVDQLNDASAPLEEQEKRKRKLIRGPREFREVRQDQHEAVAYPPAKPKPP